MDLPDLLRAHHGRENVNMEHRHILEWLNIYTPEVGPEEYIAWTEDEWRARCYMVGDKWTQWVRDRMPKTIQPKSNTLLACVKCGQHAVDMYLKQTRSADEPMTEFCYCHECKHRWCQ